MESTKLILQNRSKHLLPSGLICHNYKIINTILLTKTDKYESRFFTSKDIEDKLEVVMFSLDLDKNFIDWLFGFYGISTFVSYLTPNPFLCK